MLIESFPGELDVCNLCEEVFKRSTASPCVHCNHVHREDEWCFQRVRLGDRPNWTHPTSVRGFAAFAHEAMCDLALREGLGGRWAWALAQGASVIVGIRTDNERGVIRFWVRDTERCNVVAVRDQLIARLDAFTPVFISLEMIDPPSLHAVDAESAATDPIERDLALVLRQFVGGKFTRETLRFVNAAIAPIGERYGVEIEALQRVDDPSCVTVFRANEVPHALASGDWRAAP